MTDLAQHATLLENFLQRDPSNIRLIADLCDIYWKLGQLEKARDCLSDALEKTPDPLLQFRLATVYIELNQPKLAILLLQDAQSVQPKNLGISYNLAYAYLLDQQIEQAAQIMQADYPAMQAQMPIARYLQARILHHQGQLTQALETLEPYCTDEPNDDNALGLMALMCLDNEDFVSAQRYANRAITLNAANIDAQQVQGTLYLKDHQVPKAQFYFEQVLAKRPHSARVWLGIGLCHLMQQNVDPCIEALNKAITYQDNLIAAYNTLAWCYLIRNELDNAEQAVQKVFSINPNVPDTLGTWAVIQAERGELTQAQETIKLAIRLDPSSFAANFARAFVMDRQGKHESASRYMRRILKTPYTAEGKTMLDTALEWNQFKKN